MRNFFYHANLGTKLIAIVTTIVSLTVCVMAFLISSESIKILHEEAQSTLMNAAKRQANAIMAGFDGTVGILESTQYVLGEIMNDEKSVLSGDALKEVTLQMLESGLWGTQSYMYLFNAQEHHLVSQDPFFKPIGGNGQDVMFFAFDENPDDRGGAKLIQAELLPQMKSNMQATIRDKKVGFYNPYVASLDGKNIFVVEIQAPLFDKAGRVIGILGILIDLAQVVTEISLEENIAYEGDYVQLLAPGGIIAAHKVAEYMNKDILAINRHESTKAIVQAQKDRKDGVFEYHTVSGVPAYAALASFEIWRDLDLYWLTMVVAPQESIFEPLETLLSIIIITSIVSAICIVLVLFLYTKRISFRLERFAQHLREFFKYMNYETKAPPNELKIFAMDEIGRMLEGINHSVLKTKQTFDQDYKMLTQATQTAHQIESGDFTVRINEVAINPQLEELRVVLNAMLDILQRKIGSDVNRIENVFNAYKRFDFQAEIQDATGQVELAINALGEEIRNMLKDSSAFAQSLDSTSKELEESIHHLSESTNAQSSSLERTAAAVEEITSSMQNVSNNTEEVIRQTEDIKNVIFMIKEIVEQTNLLALNATIEAARAGEYGRGFAVVADEVRKLADKTQNSLQDIESNVGILVQGVNGMAESIREQTKGIVQINQAIGQLEDAMQENMGVANQSQEISKTIDSIATRILDDVYSKKF